jgi:flagellar biosynthesis anti-sigma factor FlgM
MANPVQGVGGALSAPQIENAGASQASRQSAGAPSQAADVALQQQPGDRADLSALGKLIGTAAKAAIAQNSFRTDLVASLKAQIAAGAYHPDPDEVAARVAAAIRS